MTPPPIAVQMYSVDALAAKDFGGALSKIGALGYRGVELYGLHGLPAREVRKMAEDAGLEFSSAHAAFPAGLDGRKTLDELAELGVPALTWSLEPEEFETKEKIALGSERVNEGTANAKEYGIEVACHNHWAEFVNSFDGRSAYDVLWDHLSVDVVAELDVYWVKLGGGDPLAVLRDLGERARFLHVKDGPADDPLAPMVAVGTGALDVPVILAAAPSARWHIVEFDRCATDIFEALRESYEFLVGRGYSSGRVAAA